MKQAISPKESRRECGEAARAPLRLALALALALAIYALARLALAQGSFGPRAMHMAEHIFIMSVLAPLLAFAAKSGLSRGGRAYAKAALFPALAAQIALFYAWHVPAVFALAMAHPAAHMALALALTAASLLFWLGVACHSGVAAWRSLFALALSGKLVCILGVILNLAPRALDAGAAHVPADAAAMLADQRLAGLFMLAACPFAYVLAGVFVAERWLRDLEARA